MVSENPVMIEEKYITPWALPKERFLVYFKWNPKANFENIKIKMEPNVYVSRVLNADLSVFENKPILKDSFVINSNQLQIEGFAGFEGWYDVVPENSMQIDFTIEVQAGSQAVESTVLKTEIVRPLLKSTNQVPEVLATMDITPTPNPNVVLQNFGNADVQEDSLKPYYEKVEGRGLEIKITQMEVPFTLDERLFVSNPKRILPNITVAGQGYGMIRIGFEYSDRLGNKYKTKLVDILVRVEQKRLLEFPITNSVEPKPILEFQAPPQVLPMRRQR